MRFKNELQKTRWEIVAQACDDFPCFGEGIDSIIKHYWVEFEKQVDEVEALLHLPCSDLPIMNRARIIAKEVQEELDGITYEGKLTKEEKEEV